MRIFPAAKQRRLDLLLEKNSEGTITVNEAATLKQLVAEAEQLMVANVKRLAAFSKEEAKRPGAVRGTSNGLGSDSPGAYGAVERGPAESYRHLVEGCGVRRSM